VNSQSFSELFQSTIKDVTCSNEQPLSLISSITKVPRGIRIELSNYEQRVS
jgi:hypothetical protein